MDLQQILDDLIQASAGSSKVKAPNGEPIPPIVYKANRYGPAIPTLVLTSLEAPENKKVIQQEYCEWKPTDGGSPGDGATYQYGGLPYKVSRPMMCLVNSLIGEVDKVNHLANEFMNSRSERAVEILGSQGSEKENAVKDYVSEELDRRQYTQTFNSWVMFLLGIVFALWTFTVVYLAITRRETLGADAVWYLILPAMILVMIAYGKFFMKDYSLFLSG